MAHSRAGVPHDTVHVVRFILVAPSAASVALVGDFNNWDRTATRLTPAGTGGLWTASVALPPGRHEYAFIVNGSQWMADPAAATTVEDDFGTTSSIITIGERAT
jgi:1,4-alpha-glucan branching enzyme